MNNLHALSIAVIFILLAGHAQGNSVIAMVADSGNPHDGDLALWLGGTNETLHVDTTTVLSATNFTSHSWLGSLISQGAFPLEINGNPVTEIEIAPGRENYSLYPEGNLTQIDDYHFGIYCSAFVSTGVTGAGDTGVYLIITDIRSLSAVSAIKVREYSVDSADYLYPLIMTSEPQQADNSADLNKDGVVSTPDLLLIQDEWHEQVGGLDAQRLGNSE